MKRFLAAVVGLAAVCGVGFGQGAAPAAKRPMTFADLMAIKRVSDPKVSPGGKWVLFSVTEVSLEKNTKGNHLWVVPLGGGAERQVTFGDGEANGRFSPDGRWVSISMKDQIYLAPWDEATGTVGEAKALTTLSTGADGGIWSPDSKSIAFTSEVYSDCSGVTLDDDCDRKSLERDAASPTKALLFDRLLYRHWNQYRAPLATIGALGSLNVRLSHILMVHLADPKTVFDLTPPFDWGNFVIAPTFSLGGPLGYAWAPDSKEIAFLVNADKEPAASTNNDIYTVDATLHDGPPKGLVAKGAALGWEPKKISTSLGSDDGPQYSPDGKWLAFRSQKRAGYESDRFRLMLFDRKTKAIKELLPKFDNWVDEFEWSSDSTSIYFNSEVAGASHIQLTDLDGRVQPVFALGSLSEMHALPGNYGLICIWNTVYRPSEAILLSASGTKALRRMERTTNSLGADQLGSKGPIGAIEFKQLTNLNGRTIAKLDTSTEESFWFPGAEGAKVQGFIVRPPGFDAGKKYPVKFLIHGGPQGAWGDAWSYRWNAELMAADGYVVVMVNPRGSTGYGQAFIDGVNGDWGGKAYLDLMKGLDAAEARFPFIDKTRECALGASYGGYMANWVLTHTNRFKCIVTHDGMYNPAAAYGDTEEMWFNEWEFRRAGDYPLGTKAGEPGQPWKFSGLPADQDPFRKWSPMLHIQDAKTPTLVIHSQKDYRLDVSEGFQLFTALQRLGVPSEMLYFPDEGHWVLKPRNAELWYKTVGDWCDKWTGKEGLTPMKRR